MRVPERIKHQIRSSLWKKADELHWNGLSATIKSQKYSEWAKDQEIGGVLSRFMDLRQIRVYLKDSILKDYARNKSNQVEIPLQQLGIPNTLPVVRDFIKPHGRRYHDGKIVSWGRAEDWKTIVTSTFERAYNIFNSKPHAVVFSRAVGKYRDSGTRAMVEDVAKRLGMQNIVWLD